MSTVWTGAGFGQSHGMLTPGRYVGAAEVEADGEPFEEKMERLTEQVVAQFSESSLLENAIRANLERLGYSVSKLD